MPDVLLNFTEEAILVLTLACLQTKIQTGHLDPEVTIDFGNNVDIY